MVEMINCVKGKGQVNSKLTVKGVMRGVSWEKAWSGLEPEQGMVGKV